MLHIITWRAITADSNLWRQGWWPTLAWSLVSWTAVPPWAQGHKYHTHKNVTHLKIFPAGLIVARLRSYKSKHNVSILHSFSCRFNCQNLEVNRSQIGERHFSCLKTFEKGRIPKKIQVQKRHLIHFNGAFSVTLGRIAILVHFRLEQQFYFSTLYPRQCYPRLKEMIRFLEHNLGDFQFKGQLHLPFQCVL